MSSRPRLVAVAATALVLAALALALIVTRTDDPYVVRAQFTDASQLVKGDLVEVGGRKVGTVEEIGLSPNGLAEVELSLESDEVRPLHEGTRAEVRTVGLSGVTNRFVDLVPGPPTTAEIDDGGVLPPTHTRGAVDLDTLFNSVTPAVRKDIQGIVRDAARALGPRTARQANAGLEMLNPALSQLTSLGHQLTLDQAALASMIEHTADLSTALAERRDSLGRSIEASAGVFAALASEREALASMLTRAPAVMEKATGTLQRLRTRTLPLIDPLAVSARPAIGPLSDLLERVEPTLTDAKPLIARLQELVPEARAALEPLPALEAAATPAMTSITKALGESLPLLSGLRPYTPEIVAGFFTGFGGSSAHPYDANGHYARIYFVGSPGSFNGLVPRPPEDQLGGYRTGMDARCPGGAEEPHPDGSNPWPEGANAGGRNHCDPADDKR